MVALAKHPDVVNYDLSSVVAMGCGAAPLSRDIARLAEKRVSGRRGPNERITVKQGWGMTEYVAFIFLLTQSRYITLDEQTADYCGQVKNNLLGSRFPPGRSG